MKFKKKPILIISFTLLIILLVFSLKKETKLTNINVRDKPLKSDYKWF